MAELAIVSLFAGIGGFDRGFELAGFKTVGQVEIDPWCQKVLTRHWPDVPKHDDITTAHGMMFGPADVVTFGSPCQDLSVAGKRAGLDGARSGLFMEAMRFIREMREGTDGLYPKFILWENVPGALNSNSGRDFATVLTEVAKLGSDVDIAWRVLDSRYFGVAQRRRRVFLVADFAGERAAEILFEPEGVRRDTQAGRGERQDLAACLTTGTGQRYDAETETLIPVAIDVRNLELEDEGVTGTLQAKNSGGYSLNYQSAAMEPIATNVYGGNKRADRPNGGFYVEMPVEESKTLDGSGLNPAANQGGTLVAEPLAFDWAAGAKHGLTLDTTAPTLQSSNGIGRAAVCFQQNTRDEVRLIGGDGQIAGALMAEPGMKQQNYMAEPVAYGIQNDPTIKVGIDIMPTLRARMLGGAPQYVGTPYAVRRLTPTECERLQAFPDSWTKYTPDGKEIPDTHRYRMCGNAVTVSTVAWIARRLKGTLCPN